jgi:transposase InsO family protein
MSQESISELLKEIYYDPNQGLQGARNLYLKAKVQNAKTTQKYVQAWLKLQETSQLHAPVKQIKHFYPIKANEQDHVWCCDLMDLSASAHNNSNCNYFLCVIDIWSRYAWVVPLKNKIAATCCAALATILKEGRTPKVLLSDNGSEFISRLWRALLAKHNIQPSYAEPGDHHRMGIVERFNKTIRALLVKYCTAYKTKRYIDAVPQLVHNYNHSIHSSTESTPAAPNAKKIAEITQKREQKANESYSQFSIGQSVRFVKNRVLFEKGAVAKYSAVHKVESFLGDKRYVLDNGNSYLYYQLQPADTVHLFEPPEVAAVERPVIVPKPLRVALQKEGVEKNNIRAGLRERKPASQLISSKGERVVY